MLKLKTAYIVINLDWFSVTPVIVFVTGWLMGMCLLYFSAASPVCFFFLVAMVFLAGTWHAPEDTWCSWFVATGEGCFICLSVWGRDPLSSANCVKRFSIYAINKPLLWHLKAKQPPEPPRWCTSSAKKMASFPVDLLCSFVFVFIPWWVSSISWISTEGAWDVAAEVLCCLLPMKKLSLTEVISFVLQPL